MEGARRFEMPRAWRVVKGAAERERKGSGERSLGQAPALKGREKVYRDTTVFLLFLLQPSLITRKSPLLFFPICSNHPQPHSFPTFLILQIETSSSPPPTPQTSPPHPSPHQIPLKSPITSPTPHLSRSAITAQIRAHLSSPYIGAARPWNLASTSGHVSGDSGSPRGWRTRTSPLSASSPSPS